MRVISGRLRGSKLISPSGESVRPTSDMVKEAVFNILQARLYDCNFLDLFAGSGNIGIEAISRGAQTVTFVDCSRDSIRLINENLEHLKLTNGEVIALDALNALKRFYQEGRRFDLIYIDPPYDSSLDEKTLSALAEFDILCENGLIIVEHKRKKDLQNYPDCFIIKSERRYGTVGLTFFAKRGCQSLS